MEQKAKTRLSFIYAVCTVPFLMACVLYSDPFIHLFSQSNHQYVRGEKNRSKEKTLVLLINLHNLFAVRQERKPHRLRAPSWKKQSFSFQYLLIYDQIKHLYLSWSWNLPFRLRVFFSVVKLPFNVFCFCLPRMHKLNERGTCITSQEDAQRSPWFICSGNCTWGTLVTAGVCSCVSSLKCKG